jgi:hypothetical protein
LAVACESADPALNEDLTFNGVASVDAIAGADGTQHDFELADPPN